MLQKEFMQRRCRNEACHGDNGSQV